MANNESKPAVKAVVTWQISIKWGGVYRTSPEYQTEEECMDALMCFVKQFQGKFLTPTIIRNVKYIEQA